MFNAATELFLRADAKNSIFDFVRFVGFAVNSRCFVLPQLRGLGTLGGDARKIPCLDRSP